MDQPTTAEVFLEKRMFSDKQHEILEQFSKQSDVLFSKGIIRTDSFTGEIGEYFVSKHFNLTRTGRSARSIDAKDANDKTYQIKAKVTDKNSFSISITNLKSTEIDFLCIAYFNELYEPIKIIRIEKRYLPDANFTISNRFLDQIDYLQIFNSQINVSKETRDEVKHFGEIFNLLRESGIAKSRKIVGDIGEYYACEELDLTSFPNGHKGADAFDVNNKTYEIKTRRVYQSGRRNSETRRINGLVGKKADFLIVVVLDKAFCCIGMWKMPLKNVINPKSAHLSVVKKTEGVEVIIPTSLSRLR